MHGLRHHPRRTGFEFAVFPNLRQGDKAELRVAAGDELKCLANALALHHARLDLHQHAELLHGLDGGTTIRCYLGVGDRDKFELICLQYVTTLLDTDDQLSFRRPGVGTDVAQKLRRGKWSIQKQVDLHGLRSDEAREVLTTFIRDAHKQGIRCVRVVHGKGLGSPGKTPVLKDKVHRWLVQKAEVVAFVQAQPAQGGAGALVVLLQPVRKAGT